jgi:hypothetical protein
MIQLIFKNVVLIFILCFMKISATHAAFLSNNFLVTSHFIESDKNTKSCKCHIQMFYPEFSSNDEDVSIKINTIIHDFVEKYNLICNKKSKINNYKITFDVRTGSKEYFSVRWIGKSGDKLVRIDTLTFKIADGSLVTPEDVFRPLSRNFMPELVKLSNNHLASNTTWSKFLDKIKTSQIQYYIFESDWYIIFNARVNKDLVDIKLPQYFVR